jgi:hypothetical protein
MEAAQILISNEINQESGFPPRIDLPAPMPGACSKSKSGKLMACCVTKKVQRNVESIGYPTDLIHYVVGDIRRTVLKLSDQRDIALLGLDTDFYDSTKVELETFCRSPRDNGVLIIDDHGHWQAPAKQSTNISICSGKMHAPMLTVIDYMGRLAVK